MSLGFQDNEKSDMRRARMVEMLGHPVSVENLTEIAEELAAGFRSGTFTRAGATGLLVARCAPCGTDPAPYVAILDQVPASIGGIGYEAACRAVRGDR